ncbi:HET-domain-containing protein [Hyaloscypha variabilis F]|uniref:HET-domain-containing protein n=1 Tax=Hyaloscypha variabilis (strain UAMH 11265 / GT02V1 / F) TaxID=1149755 RepID=A0A2J6RUD0_HYAVF|nr:HET-domain-containing protein [Hyaloscypha variabilis F]
MRLLNTSTLLMEEFWETDNTPPYAILSHTWAKEEVSFQDLKNQRKASRLCGFKKIQACCKQAKKRTINWVWIDTCCIDKSSSAELSEAINSMFRWYANAVECYAFLADVPSDDSLWPSESAFSKSRWFTRGWTLQELIAPTRVIFFSQDWVEIGTRQGLCLVIASITRIDKEVLIGTRNPGQTSIAQRMSWASRRCTTRLEDTAYCLMGLFDVNMPLLYGEGKKAFLRLQEEILRCSNDHTLFAWFHPIGFQPLRPPSTLESFLPNGGFLAHSPYVFVYSDVYVGNNNGLGVNRPYSMTNIGLCIDLPLLHLPGSMEDECIALIGCFANICDPDNIPTNDPIGIKITVTQFQRGRQGSKNVYLGVRNPHERPIKFMHVRWGSSASEKWVKVKYKQGIPSVRAYMSTVYFPQNAPFRRATMKPGGPGSSWWRHTTFMP